MVAHGGAKTGLRHCATTMPPKGGQWWGGAAARISLWWRAVESLEGCRMTFSHGPVDRHRMKGTAIFPASSRREMPIQRALEWAFGTEHARLEFDEYGETSGALRGGVDGIWIMIQRGRLGCEVDGGGWSTPADDAEIIASAVSNLPEAYGGRKMAAEVASLARAGIAPDWMRGVKPRYVPIDVRTNRHGDFAATADARHLGGEGWPAQERVGRKGRIRRDAVLYCPVRLAPTAAQISAARRHYLDWFGALLWLGAELRTLGILNRIVITDAMPPMEPWRATLDKS
jgi:hypothetical protein